MVAADSGLDAVAFGCSAGAVLVATTTAAESGAVLALEQEAMIPTLKNTGKARRSFETCGHVCIIEFVPTIPTSTAGLYLEL